MKYLAYCAADGQWYVRTPLGQTVAGPLSQGFAESYAANEGKCQARAAQSREDTRRELGCDYDPTD